MSKRKAKIGVGTNRASSAHEALPAVRTDSVVNRRSTESATVVPPTSLSFSDATPRTLLENFVAGHDSVQTTTRKRKRIEKSPKPTVKIPKVQRYSPRLKVAQLQRKTSPNKSPIRSPIRSLNKSSLSSSLRKKATMKNFLLKDTKGPTPRTMIEGFLGDAVVETPVIGTLRPSAVEDDLSVPSFHLHDDSMKTGADEPLEDSFLGGYNRQPLDRLQMLKNRMKQRGRKIDLANFTANISEKLSQSEHDKTILESIAESEPEKQEDTAEKSPAQLSTAVDKTILESTAETEPEKQQDMAEKSTAQLSTAPKSPQKAGENMDQSSPEKQCSPSKNTSPTRDKSKANDPDPTQTITREVTRLNKSKTDTLETFNASQIPYLHPLSIESSPGIMTRSSRRRSTLVPEKPKVIKTSSGQTSFVVEAEVYRTYSDSDDKSISSKSQNNVKPGEVDISESQRVTPDEVFAEQNESLSPQTEFQSTETQEPGTTEETTVEIHTHSVPAQDIFVGGDNQDNINQEEYVPSENLVDIVGQSNQADKQGPNELVTVAAEDEPSQGDQTATTPRLKQLKITEVLHSPMEFNGSSTDGSTMDRSLAMLTQHAPPIRVQSEKPAQSSEPTQGKQMKKKSAKQSDAKGHPPRLPRSLTKSIFTHFSKCKVSKEALDEVEKVADDYWKNTVDDLTAYVEHAHRKGIEPVDIELLMRRQGFVTEKQSMYTLIRNYLPMEYRKELIPVARSGNKIEPKSFLPP